MVFGHSSRSLFILTIAICLVLIACFAGSTVQADGQSGDWPYDPPDPINTGGDDEGGGDGIEALVTIMTLMELIL
jgi:hypothetical protein